jgi:hypothetical protein
MRNMWSLDWKDFLRLSFSMNLYYKYVIFCLILVTFNVSTESGMTYRLNVLCDVTLTK